MPAKRFQIYLSNDQHHQIRSLAQSQNITMAELIRQAVDQYLNQNTDPSDLSSDPLWEIVGILGNNCE